MGASSETSLGTGKSKVTRVVVFLSGSALALTLGGLVVWLGSRDNHQGEYYDLETGQWDVWFVADHFIYPLGFWVLLFALFGGFRRQED